MGKYKSYKSKFRGHRQRTWIGKSGFIGTRAFYKGGKHG